MIAEHKDIQKILPYGEQLRGFANQKYLTSAELKGILQERGIFPLNADKDYTVPLLQTLMLSPKEFDKIREAFSTREDNKKVSSSDITWSKNANLLQSDVLDVDVTDFVRLKHPTCKLKQAIRFAPVSNNAKHLKADIVLERNDINKSWYEQTNVFEASIELIDDGNGNGRIIISHTAPETKAIAEQAVKEQLEKYKQKGVVPTREKVRRIVFRDFTNSERFVFFFRLTNYLECDFFSCEDIKDISIKPEETVLPEGIKWMENLNKIALSGRSLGKKDFIKNTQFHDHLILWTVDANFKYEYQGQEGTFTVSFGFPDYSKRKEKAEFELNISSLSPARSLDPRAKKVLKSQLLSEIDRQKSIVYNNFLDYKNGKK